MEEKNVCNRCELSKNRTNVVWGCGNSAAGILLLGESPEQADDRSGKPFTGKAGDNLTEMLDWANLTRDMVWLTNTLKCRPPPSTLPHPDQIKACATWLEIELRTLQPWLVVPMGAAAWGWIKSRTDGWPKSSFTGSVGQAKELDLLGSLRTVFPVFHPAATLYDQSKKGTQKDAFEKMWRLIVDSGKCPELAVHSKFRFTWIEMTGDEDTVRSEDAVFPNETRAQEHLQFILSAVNPCWPPGQDYSCRCGCVRVEERLG